MYLLVRKDLGMSKGKIAAQCCHAAEGLAVRCSDGLMEEYRKNGHPKVVLKADNLDEMLKIAKLCEQTAINHELVVDEGRTQLEPNTVTVLGIGPVRKKYISQILGNLKLL